MNGVLVDIKRLAVHDGPGIRTTLFFKGCPLHCRWCHNPESISPTPEIGFHARKCVGCGQCAEVCPTGAQGFENGEHVFNRELCAACGKCVEACLPGALEMFGAEISAAQAVEAVLADKTFYEQSGGGCTVSGGEPLLQAEFCAAVFRELKTHQIHCAVDTSGAVHWEKIQAVLPHTDLFLYDLKHVDDDLHRQHVGCSNRLILENLQRLSECGTPIEIRIPTIPRFNADEESMNAIGRFLSELDNIVGVRLLPYHFAHSKYDVVGHPDTMPRVAPPTEPLMEQLRRCLARIGLTVK